MYGKNKFLPGFDSPANKIKVRAIVSREREREIFLLYFQQESPPSREKKWERDFLLYFQQESPPAWTQEASRAPCSKYSLCWRGGGVPTLDKGIPTLDRTMRTDRRLWKQYIPHPSSAGDKKVVKIFTCIASLDNVIKHKTTDLATQECSLRCTHLQTVRCYSKISTAMQNICKSLIIKHILTRTRERTRCHCLHFH